MDNLDRRIIMDKAEPQVLLIMTGGTICMQRSVDGFIPSANFLEQCLAPRPSFHDASTATSIDVVDEYGNQKSMRGLRTPPSAYDRRIRYAVLEYNELIDSSAITSANWDKIAKTVYDNYSLFDGFVVLHGTDTMAYSASALSFMLQNLAKPVIFTGSQKPMSELQTDATDNLLGSMIIASHYAIPEVCLFFDHKLFRGNRATKTSATKFGAFQSPNLPPLATTTSAGVKVLWHLIPSPPPPLVSRDLSPEREVTGTPGRRREAQQQAMKIQTCLDTTSIACLRVFPGMKPEMVDAVLKIQGLRGFILETFGMGNAPKALLPVLSDAVERGVVVVNITQCLNGNVAKNYAPAIVMAQVGVVFGRDMSTEAALTKLAYLLTLPGLESREVARKMEVSLRGELTGDNGPQFEHPGIIGTASPAAYD